MHMVPAGPSEDSPVQKSLHSGRGTTEDFCVGGGCVKGRNSDVFRDVPGDYQLMCVLELGGMGAGGVAALILHRRNVQEHVLIVVRGTLTGTTSLSAMTCCDRYGTYLVMI